MSVQARTAPQNFGNALAPSASMAGTDASQRILVTPDGHFTFTGKVEVVVDLKYTF